MKRYIAPVLAVALVGLAFTLPIDGKKKGSESLEIGKLAPEQNLKMMDISGKSYTLTDLKEENGLLVVFTCNTCPFVVGGSGLGEGWEGRYNDMHTLCEKNGMGMVLINSNEAKRDGADSMEKMKEHAAKQGYKSKYLVDKNHKLADAFGAKTTPHIFLFNSDMKLVYKGAIDDNNASADEVKETWLKNAINSLKKGEKIKPPTTRNKGCSIKRVKA